MLLSDRIQKLRRKMHDYGIDACIIPHSDPHTSEYPSEHWLLRNWLSGFTGSAGTLVVGLDEAGLWTDSRYFIQAEQELEGSYIELFKEGENGVPTYSEWLCEILLPGSKVAFDGQSMPLMQYKEIAKKLKSASIEVDYNVDIADEIWDGRPPLPEDSIILHEKEWVSATREEKIELVRSYMREKGATHYATSSLDDIAWLLNLRGTDVQYNPVFNSFLIVEHDEVKLFVNPHKLTAQIAQKLTADNITVSLYENYYDHLSNIPQDKTIYFDPNKTTVKAYISLPKRANKIEGTSIITHLKSMKNDKEIANLKETLLYDGVAMVKFLYWLNSNIGKEEITEISASEKLKEFRAEQPNYKGESFAAISGYAEHGAIVHYTASEESNSKLEPKGLYLIDSGGQYSSGTTDITRTISLGEVSEQEKTDFTLVLKGHIALAKLIFPYGARGVHIDMVARKALWKNGLNYGHGTGHGIGYYLNVHEGPQSIRPQDNGAKIEPGMITSNEPGVYREGEYGIRIENLILSKIKEENQFGTFMEFETLSLCPIDTKLIDISLMTNEEIEWINNYHDMVYDKLNPLINDDEIKTWLENNTLHIAK